MKHSLLPFMLLLLATNPVMADPVAESWERGNEAFFEQRYLEAAELYSAIAQDLDNAAIRYNLGTVHLAAGRYGHAIHQLRLALLRQPTGELDERIRDNLELARELRLARDRDRIEKGIILWDESRDLTYTLFTLLSLPVCLALFLPLFLLLCLSLAWLGLRRPYGRGLARAVALALLVPTLLLGVLLAGRIWTEGAYSFGVVVSSEAVLRDGPSPHATGAPVAEGLEVQLLGQPEQGLHKVRLGAERQGYLDCKDVAPLR